ncbi:hypothetical protein EDB84DRAFT_1443870 [Lactarius hengduanensis]|nr:hypothetical protein EDB84DRAFT_1443870 [Lactarius hengduanensis]
MTLSLPFSPVSGVDIGQSMENVCQPFEQQGRWPFGADPNADLSAYTRQRPLAIPGGVGVYKWSLNEGIIAQQKEFDDLKAIRNLGRDASMMIEQFASEYHELKAASGNGPKPLTLVGVLPFPKIKIREACPEIVQWNRDLSPQVELKARSVWFSLATRSRTLPGNTTTGASNEPGLEFYSIATTDFGNSESGPSNLTRAGPRTTESEGVNRARKTHRKALRRRPKRSQLDSYKPRPRRRRYQRGLGLIPPASVVMNPFAPAPSTTATSGATNALTAGSPASATPREATVAAQEATDATRASDPTTATPPAPNDTLPSTSTLPRVTLKLPPRALTASQRLAAVSHLLRAITRTPRLHPNVRNSVQIMRRKESQTNKTPKPRLRSPTLLMGIPSRVVCMRRWNELQPGGQGLASDFEEYFKALTKADKEPFKKEMRIIQLANTTSTQRYHQLRLVLDVNRAVQVERESCSNRIDLAHN